MEKRITTTDIKSMKAGDKKIAALTAYDYCHARLLDESGVDLVLVGDSLGMVFAGYESTLPVTVDDVFYHAQAVSRGVKHALVVADMPFLSYQIDRKTALENCGRFIKQGVAQAVKIEGGSESTVALIENLIAIGIPVMGHIGLTPQLLHTLGGYRTQGKSEAEAEAIEKAALLLEAAGVFSLVLEAVPKSLGERISRKLKIPVLGIGAGVHCDGQILVTPDVLGLLDDFKPRFARRYAELAAEIRSAVKRYCSDVRENRFPSDLESYN